MKTSAAIPATGSRPEAPFDAEQVRGDFPVLSRTVYGKPLVYLDNAATAQKPQVVIDALDRYYRTYNANIHRGVHALSIEATNAFDAGRSAVRRFLGAGRPEEIVFVRSATEGINLVAQAFARPRLQRGDEILISNLEHHANIVPWQIVCGQTGAVLKVVPINDAGEIELDAYEKMLGPRTRLVAMAHVSNALGTVNPVHRIVESAHRRGVPVLIDGAQAAPHRRIDVSALGCDFYVITGHKMFGPTGIGALYGRYDLLDRMEPYQGGGEMILSVTFAKTEYNHVPYKFEAGTPHIAGVVGLAAAIDYLEGIGQDRVAAYEHDLLQYATAALTSVEGVRIIGTARQKAAVLSFLVGSIHPHDVGTILDREGVAVRTGHHCAQPVMERYGLAATVRASLALYNTRQDVDALVAAVEKVRKVFR
jgi:cysteine desulfurase/selenocysteine lyase